MNEEKLGAAVSGLYRENKTVFLCSLLTGLAAHGFALTNKLVNHDEIESIFGKGATITSGRWGLELIKPLFPDLSMPWLYGLITLLLLSVAACVIVKLLDIRSPLLGGIAGALILCSPSLTGTFCFMFTSSSYAVSFLFAVLAAALFRRGGWRRCTAGIVLLVLSLSIYQAYLALTASLLVLLLIRDCVEAKKSLRDILLGGIGYLAWMLVAAALYYAVTLLVLRFTGAAFNTYVTDNVNGIGFLRRIRMAYDNFYYVFSFGNFSLAPTELSRRLHVALILLTLPTLAAAAIRTKKLWHILLAGALTLLLPLSINSMYLIMAGESIHTLVLYSFVALYLLSAMTADGESGRLGGAVRTVLAAILCVLVLINVGFANKVYLKLHLQYENAESFYTALLTRVTMTEGFDEDCDLAVIGRQENLLYEAPELYTELFMAAPNELVNIYSRENFIRVFLGCDIPFAGEEELTALEQDERFLAMAEYPYDGSVRRIDGHIVVKLG